MKPFHVLKKLHNVPLNSYLDKLYDPLSIQAKKIQMRKEAKRIIKMVREKRERKVVDRALMSRIREYARENFGSSAYWPWLVCFTEIRGAFHEGWVPCDFYRFHLIKKINPVHSSFLSFTKSFDSRLFGDFSIPYIIFKTNDTLFDMNLNRLDEAAALEKIRAAGGEVVIKKDSGRWGRDIIFVDSSKVEREMLSPKYDIIIQKAFEQHPEIAAVYPRSINTIRITTFLDFDSTVKVKNVVMRIGAGGSRTDNFKTGGHLLFFDEEGRGGTQAYSGITLEPENEHPDTGYAYRDLRITALDLAKEKCIQSHYKYPYLRLIGWDVFIDRENKPRLIEWNGKYPGYWPMEALVGPWWRTEEIRRMA